MSANKTTAHQGIDAWYQETVSKLYAFAYTLLQNREEAEDITQETYFRCLRKNGPNLPPYPYLKKVARNLIYDRYRRWQKSQNPLANHPQAEEMTETEDRWLDRAMITEFMNHLPEQYRLVLELRIIKGYSRKETALHMERSEDAIRGLQYRALQMLRELFNATGENGG